MGWCQIPDCKNLALAGPICAKHRESAAILHKYDRKGELMKVRANKGYQLKGGKTGVVELPEAEARQAIQAGYATEVKETKAEAKSTAKK